MPQAKKRNASNFAALTYELVPGADGVTTEAHLLPPGPFRSTDIRPEECAAWQLDAAIAARVIARAEARKNDTVIVYEHQDLHSKTNGQKVLAAGWVPNSYEWREGKGLYAVNIGWTEEAKREIAAKQIRYISTLFYYDAVTGEVLEIVSIALTNTPGLDGLDALAALARDAFSRNETSDLSTKGANEMPDEKQLAALTAERDGLKTNVAALTSERDGLNTKLAALTVERDALKVKVDAVEADKAAAALAAEKVEHTELLTAALTDGRLVPAQKPWAEKQSLAALTEYLEATNPIAALTKQTNGKDVAGNHGLSDVELAACAKMNVSPEEFAKNKVKK
jgi:phage I-like protein